MDEFTRMVLPRPFALPAEQRRRFWMHPGEPRQFGALCLTLQADVQDGETLRPFFLAVIGTVAGRIPVQAMMVPAAPGVVLAPLAIRVQGPQQLLAVLLEWRDENVPLPVEDVA